MNPRSNINNITHSDANSTIIDLSTHGKPIMCCNDNFVELTQSQRNYIASLVNLVNDLCSNNGNFVTYDISLDNQQLLLHMFEYPTSQTEDIIEIAELSYDIDQLTFDFEYIRGAATKLHAALMDKYTIDEFNRWLKNYEKND